MLEEWFRSYSRSTPQSAFFFWRGSKTCRVLEQLLQWGGCSKLNGFFGLLLPEAPESCGGTDCGDFSQHHLSRDTVNGDELTLADDHIAHLGFS